MGKGTFGEVRKCKSKLNDNKEYAIKIIQTNKQNLDFKEIIKI